MDTTWDQYWKMFILEYREIRPPGGPIGWYNLTDLRAAFDAGRRASFDAGLEEIFDRIRKAAEGVTGHEQGRKQ